MELSRSLNSLVLLLSLSMSSILGREKKRARLVVVAAAASKIWNKSTPDLIFNLSALSCTSLNTGGCRSARSTDNVFFSLRD